VPPLGAGGCAAGRHHGEAELPLHLLVITPAGLQPHIPHGFTLAHQGCAARSCANASATSRGHHHHTAPPSLVLDHRRSSFAGPGLVGNPLKDTATIIARALKASPVSEQILSLRVSNTAEDADRTGKVRVDEFSMYTFSAEADPGAVRSVIGVIILIGIIGNSGSSDDKKSSSSSSSSSSSKSSTASPTTPAGPTKPAANFTTGADGAVTARFAIGDNFTEGLIKDGARFETIDILQYAKETYPSAPEVIVQGTFPMKDAYGNTSTDVVINLTYLRSTLDQINFAGVDRTRSGSCATLASSPQRFSRRPTRASALPVRPVRASA
jgi:hypothetical protein